MNYILFLVTLILLIINIFIILRIYLIKKSIKEIEYSFDYILKMDTNSIITISSSDKSIKNLATSLNNQLIELRTQKLEYTNGNQELKEIITNISHDLRTPLTAIKGYIDILKEENLSKKQKKYLNIIHEKSQELVNITEQLLNFSKAIDLENISIQKEKCCINEILEETLISYYEIFKEKNINPNIQICSEKIYKNLNKNSLIRILENIFSNAFKYSNGDFKVELKKDGTITFSNKSNILDSTTVSKIFNRYFSVENAKESVGIGLAIVKQLVELNNGKIYANYINETFSINITFD